MIGGDFNAPHVNWSDEGSACQGTNLPEVHFDIEFSRCLRRSVEKAYVLCETSCRLLDPSFISKRFEHWSVAVDGVSDYRLVFLKCDLNVSQKVTTGVKQYGMITKGQLTSQYSTIPRSTQTDLTN